MVSASTSECVDLHPTSRAHKARYSPLAAVSEVTLSAIMIRNSLVDRLLYRPVSVAPDSVGELGHRLVFAHRGLIQSHDRHINELLINLTERFGTEPHALDGTWSEVLDKNIGLGYQFEQDGFALFRFQVEGDGFFPRLQEKKAGATPLSLLPM